MGSIKRPWSAPRDRAQALAARSPEESAERQMKAGSSISDVMNASKVLRYERQHVQLQKVTCVFFMLGLLFAVCEFESCEQVCITDADPTAIGPDGKRMPCELTPILARCARLSAPFKALVTLSTITAMVFHLKMYRVEARMIAHRLHTTLNIPLEKNTLRDTDLLRTYLMEAIILGLHVPPGISFKVNLEFRGLIAEYRIEAVLVVWMFIRSWCFWKVYRDEFFLKHTVKSIAAQL